MKQIELRKEEEKALAVHLCQRCGGVMRLIGSEAHPAQAEMDLLTYCCTECDEFLVLPFESGANRMKQAAPSSEASSIKVESFDFSKQRPQTFPKHPVCPRCDVPMWLSKVRTKPKKTDYFYECKACGDKMSVVHD